jgi:hypothetical protein
VYLKMYFWIECIAVRERFGIYNLSFSGWWTSYRNFAGTLRSNDGQESSEIFFGKKTRKKKRFSSSSSSSFLTTTTAFLTMNLFLKLFFFEKTIRKTRRQEIVCI